MQINSPKALYKYDRPREKLLAKGVAALTNSELLQIMIGAGTKGHNVASIAAQVAELVKSARPTVSELTKLKGINLAKAAIIVAAFELAGRTNQDAVRIETTADVLHQVHEFKTRKQEHLVLLVLDGGNRLISKRVISIGTLTSTLIHPREVFADPLAERAASIILVHNHPSGLAEPSNEDRVITGRLVQAAVMLGINFQDHLIITEGDQYFSFRTNGLLV